MSCISSGSLSNTAPPRERFTVLAGQPKFRSITGAPSSQANAALSARHAGSEPSNCTRIGVPAQVRLPSRSSGASLWKAVAGSRRSVMRMNSVTHQSMPPTRVSTSRRISSTRPSIGARAICTNHYLENDRRRILENPPPGTKCECLPADARRVRPRRAEPGRSRR
ncbi:Uncharacterised protein [Acinetobacter baumannii]|nr:Uncharacterised protein [Acinetobacter baumannii]